MKRCKRQEEDELVGLLFFELGAGNTIKCCELEAVKTLSKKHSIILWSVFKIRKHYRQQSLCFRSNAYCETSPIFTFVKPFQFEQEHFCFVIHNIRQNLQTKRV